MEVSRPNRSPGVVAGSSTGSTLPGNGPHDTLDGLAAIVIRAGVIAPWHHDLIVDFLENSPLLFTIMEILFRAPLYICEIAFSFFALMGRPVSARISIENVAVASHVHGNDSTHILGSLIHF
jgi:hypothetical protein